MGSSNPALRRGRRGVREGPQAPFLAVRLMDRFAEEIVRDNRLRSRLVPGHAKEHDEDKNDNHEGQTGIHKSPYSITEVVTKSLWPAV